MSDFDQSLLESWLRDSYRGGWSPVSRASCGYNRTALLSDHGHVPVVIAHCRVNAAEQLVERLGERNARVLMGPEVITGALRAVNAVSSLLVEKLERAQLRLTDGHSYCP